MRHHARAKLAASGLEPRWLVCAALGLACGGDEARTATRAAVRDVADGAPVAAVARVEEGVTIMEHDAGALERAPRLALDAAPIAVLGGAEGDAAYDLTDVRLVALLPDERLAAMNRSGDRLLVFGRDGRGERMIGRPGRGPGEFVDASALAQSGGDTLLVHDAANARLSWVLPTRGIVAERPFAVGPRLDPIARMGGVLRDGRLLLHAAGWSQWDAPDSATRTMVPVFVVDAQGETGTEIARIPDLEQTMVETRFRGRRRMSSTTLRFGRAAHVVAWDTLIATGSGDGYAVDLRAADGRVVSRLLMRDLPRRPVTREMRERWIARDLDRFNAQPTERAVDPDESRRLAREAPFADSLPPYERLFVTPDRSTLWIVDAIAPGDSAWRATAFRADGAIVGRLHAAGTSTPVAFGDDRVVVRTEDELGVVTLRVHRLVPGN